MFRVYFILVITILYFYCYLSLFDIDLLIQKVFNNSEINKGELRFFKLGGCLSGIVIIAPLFKATFQLYHNFDLTLI